MEAFPMVMNLSKAEIAKVLTYEQAAVHLEAL
jgi:hypothetical protein